MMRFFNPLGFTVLTICWVSAATAYVARYAFPHQSSYCIDSSNLYLIFIAYLPTAAWFLASSDQRPFVALFFIITVLPAILVINCVSFAIAIELLAHVPLAWFMISKRMHFRSYVLLMLASLAISTGVQLLESGPTTLPAIVYVEWILIFLTPYLLLFSVVYWSIAFIRRRTPKTH